MSRRNAIFAAALLLYAIALAVTWHFSTHRAARQTEAMLDYAILDLNDTLNGSIDTMLMHIAESIVDELGKAAPLPDERAQEIIRKRLVDELNVIDRNGRIIATSDKRVLGGNMKTVPSAAKFMVLCEGGRHAYSQPFRNGAHNPDVRRKYVGVAFPGGEGFVQIGMDETRVTQMFPSIMRFIFDEWLLGEKGFFLCASIDDGHLISNPARHRDQAVFLSQTGYNPLSSIVVEDGKTTFRQRLFGDVCDCRAVIFAGHRIVAALPLAEYYTTRTIYTVAMGIVLAAVIGMFAFLLWRIDKASVQLKAFYRAEEKKRTEELELGCKIQMAALPSEYPSNEYCRLEPFIRPAREVGGDFYDFFNLDETHIAFLVADVSGKGITGALYMMTAKTLIKNTMLAFPESHPADVLSRVNRELCRNNPAEMFLTVWMGVLNIDNGRVLFANAGHNSPLVKRVSGTVEWLRERSGCPLACFDNVAYRQYELKLVPGDALFIYTDGVTEAMEGSGALFGDERLLAVLQSAPVNAEDGADSSLCALVREKVASFVSGAAQMDDLTMLTVQYLAAPERYMRTFPSNETALKDATSFLEERLDAAECPMKAKMQLLIVLDEVLSNIIRCSGASGIALELRFSKKPRSVAMFVSDDGKPFDPLNAPLPDISVPLEERQAGGLGILLLRKTMDELSYRYSHGCNVLHIRKNLQL